MKLPSVRCKTRSSTKELFTPFKDPEQEFRSSRKLLKTLSLDESRSPVFNLFSDLEEYSEEEVAKTMAETMEQYMSKTRADYGSRISRPKIDDKDSFELKGQFLKELRDNTFGGLDHKDANEHIDKAFEIVDLFHIPNITQDQEVILFYNELDVPTRQILDSKGVIPSKTAADAKVAIQKMVEYSQKWHNGTSNTRSTKTSDGLAAIQAQLNNLGRETKSKSAKRHEENSNMIKEIRASTDVAVRNQGASIKTLEIQIGQIRKYCKEKKGSYGPQFSEAYSYGASHIDNSIPRKEKDPRSFTLPCYINNVCFDNALADLGASVSVMPLSTYINLDFIILDMPEDVKVPLILRRPFLSTAHAKIDVFKRKITLRVRDEKIVFKSVKPASSLIKRVYMLGLRERMELDLEARLMGETLVLNRSLDPLYEDYIELNDLNEPLELRRDQVDNLMPTIEEGELIDEPMIDIIKTMNNESFDEYPSFCDFDRKIHIDCAYNLRFSCMIDQDMGDIILVEPFCKASCVEVRRFDGLITIHNGSDNVTYQMARSHPSFKHLSNAQCNKIKQLLKVSVHDKLNGILHPYQKLKSFYKGVLNLGPEYVRDAKMEEWLTRGHISVHEIE
ncbi:hypothetical protein Tco_1407093 [Tanacetum coccineum]